MTVAEAPGPSGAVRHASSRGLTGAHDPPVVEPDGKLILGAAAGGLSEMRSAIRRVPRPTPVLRVTVAT